MSDLNNPNRRITDAHLKGDAVGTATSSAKGSDPVCKMPMRRPLPGIVILVHGVNDVGEAYATQAAGICEGLNLRLGRKDMTPGDWDVERSCPNTRQATYERRADAQGNNAIIPFYWGYRPVDKATYEADQQRYQEELRKRNADPDAPYDAYFVEGRSNPKTGYQNTDCFGNRLDESFCKNGGVFANATTNLIDMWGPGGNILGVARWGSTIGADNSHGVYDNPHRIYYVLAAQRLANLILMIRDDPRAGDDSISIVAHSQGTLVAMLANFIVANDDSGYRPADCLIFNHSPYSIEATRLERMQSFGHQQSARARKETLANLCRLIDAQRMPGPSGADLACAGIASMQASEKPEHMRDNHGKVFNYFCPHDRTVSLWNVQGVGWQGLPVEDAKRCGPALAQRIFMDGRALHETPGQMRLPDLKRDSTKEAMTTADIPTGELRDINAPRLPDFNYVFRREEGCAYLSASDWGVNATGAALDGDLTVVQTVKDPRPVSEQGIPANRMSAVDSKPLTKAEIAKVESAFAAQGKAWRILWATRVRQGLMIGRYKTAEEFEAQSTVTKTTISNHSAIVLDQKASCYVTAFDLAIGRCKSYDETKVDGGAFWQKLLRVADWRDSDALGDKPYYTLGILPEPLKKQMNKPPIISGVVNESTTTEFYSSVLFDIDTRIARHKQNRSQWPKREWDEKMRGLENERRSVVEVRNYEKKKQSRFPVAHGK